MYIPDLSTLKIDCCTGFPKESSTVLYIFKDSDIKSPSALK